MSFPENVTFLQEDNIKNETGFTDNVTTHSCTRDMILETPLLYESNLHEYLAENDVIFILERSTEDSSNTILISCHIPACGKN